MKEILVETSARHVHVTQETLEVLFGKGAQLEVRAMLSQPGQFVSKQRVNVVGYKVDKVTGQKVEAVLKNVSILGPCRKLNQIELSATDARSIGIAAPIRESGDIKGSGACKLVADNSIWLSFLHGPKIETFLRTASTFWPVTLSVL